MDEIAEELTEKPLHTIMPYKVPGLGWTFLPAWSIAMFRLSDDIPPNCDDPCWFWTGRTNRNGYGRVRLGKREPVAHRAMYEALVGPIPKGLVLDHICLRHHCINPSHLEPVTHAENTRRGRAVLFKSKVVAVEAALSAEERHDQQFIENMAGLLAESTILNGVSVESSGDCLMIGHTNRDDSSTLPSRIHAYTNEDVRSINLYANSYVRRLYSRAALAGIGLLLVASAIVLFVGA